MNNERDPIILPKEENLFETERYAVHLFATRSWLVLLSIIVLTGVGALCFGWWLPGVILIVGGGAPAGAVLRRIIAERAMVRRMRERGARKT